MSIGGNCWSILGLDIDRLEYNIGESINIKPDLVGGILDGTECRYSYKLGNEWIIIILMMCLMKV